MPLCRIIHGTTLHGKAVNAGDVLPLNDSDYWSIRRDVEIVTAPAPEKEEAETAKPTKKK